MSYRCQLCSSAVPHRQPLRKHIVYRSNKQIEREIPVCEDCQDTLARGTSLSTLIASNGRYARMQSTSVPVKLVVGKTISRKPRS